MRWWQATRPSGGGGGLRRGAEPGLTTAPAPSSLPRPPSNYREQRAELDLDRRVAARRVRDGKRRLRVEGHGRAGAGVVHRPCTKSSEPRSRTGSCSWPAAL
ncbi:hypothetical protein R5R35_002641 [Gryllus longicercus]|uniref:Uncharacterized protein n=1 Tax=Gryllus longicercus TaxID=2509291 RepID=A0AAN9W7U9_9ORTH